MSNKMSHFAESAADKPSTVGGTVSDTATHLKDKVSDLGRTAADKIDENRGAAASGLDKAASALHENAGNLPGGEKVSSLAHTAAEKLSSTAGYVRTHDVNRMMADVETLVKNNPGPSLLVAAAIGFLVGRAFSND
jgi:ElaB/YqjD/DUF883 family membrane-anchored ribosome-binding protein